MGRGPGICSVLDAPVVPDIGTLSKPEMLERCTQNFHKMKSKTTEEQNLNFTFDRAKTTDESEADVPHYDNEMQSGTQGDELIGHRPSGLIPT